MIPLSLTDLAVPATIAVIAMAVLLVIRGIVMSMARRWAKTTATQFDDIIVSSLRTPTIFWCAALGLYLGITFSDLPPKYSQAGSTLLTVIIIASVTIAAANLSGKIFRNYVQSSSLPIPTTGLAYGLLNGSILIIGFLIILSVFGVSIAPLLTALGVGGLAVALALQDTLANLFAGIHILMEKSIRVGDFVKLESGQEGYVEDITWRTTRVRMLPNNMVVIPNKILSQSIVTNFHLPEKRMSLLIPIGVSYAADPDAVERILVEETTNAVGDIPGLLGDPAPVVRFIPGFGDSSLDFTLICQVGEFADQYPVQHELRKRILRRFRAEGVEIPFPQRTVHIRNHPEE